MGLPYITEAVTVERLRSDGAVAASGERLAVAVQPWRWTAWIAAGLAAASISITIVEIPLQVPDCLVPLLQILAAPSAATMFRDTLDDPAFFRPAFWAQSKLIFDAAHGHYFGAFKSVHVLLIVALIACFASIARVRNRTDLTAFLFALMVLTGMHTFVGLVREAYPVNHYLEVAVASAAALRLTMSRGGWLQDVAALVLFAIAALTLESGLLVWVVVAAAWAVGSRGISPRAVATMTAMVAAYFAARLYFHVGMPSIWERSTGFGFSRLDPAAIARQFEHSVALLYLYNFSTSILSVLFSEPRSGTWDVTSRLLRGDVQPSLVASVVSACVATCVIGWFAAARWRPWDRRRLEPADRIVAVFGAVLVANAAMCCVYTKDEIMSTAGVFYALAVYVAARECLSRFAALPSRRPAMLAFAVVLAAGSTAWGIRATGLYYEMYWKASKVRYEWAEVEVFLRDQQIALRTPDEVRLVERLRADAMRAPLLNAALLPHWAKAWFA
jgi:hypothetical protein